MNWLKYGFNWEKMKLKSTGNFVHTTEFLTLIMQVSTQTDNHKYKKCCN